MDTKEFELLLNNTAIPSNLEIGEQGRIIEPLQSYINGIIPSRLYKYRCCTGNHISAFYKDEIWLSTANNMNDGFDTRLFFNKSEFKEQYEKLTSDDRVLNFFEALKSNPDLQSAIRQFPGAETAMGNLDLSNELLLQGIKNAKEKIDPIICDTLDSINMITQQALLFCCFSETVTSASMWGQYAENESGFCLEYEFNTVDGRQFIIDGKTFNVDIYPIIYKEERYPVASEIISYLVQYRMLFINAVNTGRYSNIREIQNDINKSLNCPDLLFGTKVALYKSLEWQFEKEWRLFCNISNNDTGKKDHICLIKKPTALYLGRRISEVNEKILRLFADEKGIPVYKMHLDDEHPTYELKIGNRC